MSIETAISMSPVPLASSEPGSELVVGTLSDGQTPGDRAGQGYLFRDTVAVSRWMVTINNELPQLLHFQETEGDFTAELVWPTTSDIQLRVRRVRRIHGNAVSESIMIENPHSDPFVGDLSFDVNTGFRSVMAARKIPGAEPQRGPGQEPMFTETKNGLVLWVDDEDGHRREVQITIETVLQAAGRGLPSGDQSIPPEGVQRQYTLIVPPQGLRIIDVKLEFSEAITKPELDNSRIPRPELEQMITNQFPPGELPLSDFWFRTPNPDYNVMGWRALLDTRLLITRWRNGHFVPWAGIPHFATPFIRDALQQAGDYNRLDSRLMRGSILGLSPSVGVEFILFTEEELGNWGHEFRQDAPNNLLRLPFGMYYGSGDSTLTALGRLGDFLRQTGDEKIWNLLQPVVKDGFDYMKRNRLAHPDRLFNFTGSVSGSGLDIKSGLVIKSWRDSPGGIIYPDGSPVPRPVAPVEFQSRGFRACESVADAYHLLGDDKAARPFEDMAYDVWERFHKKYWIKHPEGEYLAVAVDGNGHPVPTRTSSPGHVPWSGILHPDQAELVILRLMEDDFFSGWGIRTVSTLEPCYRHQGYHEGAVWPMDTGHTKRSARVRRTRQMQEVADKLMESMLDIARYTPQKRVPELISGYPREAGRPPIPYREKLSDDFELEACDPQGWSASLVVTDLVAALNPVYDLKSRTIHFDRPWIPSYTHGWYELHNLQTSWGPYSVKVSGRGFEVVIEVLKKPPDLKFTVGGAKLIVRGVTAQNDAPEHGTLN
jgi:glycogen debranching enzyme